MRHPAIRNLRNWILNEKVRPEMIYVSPALFDVLSEEFMRVRSNGIMGSDVGEDHDKFFTFRGIHVSVHDGGLTIEQLAEFDAVRQKEGR